jgi:hypothetical protein
VTRIPAQKFNSIQFDALNGPQQRMQEAPSGSIAWIFAHGERRYPGNECIMLPEIRRSRPGLIPFNLEGHGPIELAISLLLLFRD